MFKKQANYKSSTTIRGSERKSLVADVQRLFPGAFTNRSQDEVRDLLESILPGSGIESAAFTSTKGSRGVLYSHSGVPVFVKYEDKLIPSLQTVWKCPQLVTTVLTGAQVLANLASGSDLMVKGMFDYSSTVKRGEVVGIRVTDRDYIVALGTAAIDFEKVNRDEGGKGIINCISLGDTITPEASYTVFTAMQEKAKSLHVTEGLQGLALDEPLQEVEVKEEQVPVVDAQEPPMATSEIDEAFVQALLYGLYSIFSTGEQTNISLPINSSTLIDTYVLPYLPSKHTDLTLKKTSWKKAAKFIAKQKILKSKESKGQVSITGIDWSSADLRSFVPYRLPEPSSNQQTQTQSDASALLLQEGTEKCQVEVEDFYKVPPKLLPLFVTPPASEYLTLDSIKAQLSEYFQNHNLVSSETPKLVKLNPEVRHTLAPTSTHSALARDTLVKSFLGHCERGYRINNPYLSKAASKIRKGKAPTIQVIIETRNGKRSTTRITGVGHYLTSGQVNEVQGELKVKCQVSVSIGEAKGVKSGSGAVEVVVQGKKGSEVQEVLKVWGIKKEWIQIDDKTK